MQVVTLEIKDDFFEKFIDFINTLPDGKVIFKRDKLKNELIKRVEAIDRGDEKLTPYLEGMNEMLQRLKVQYADS